MTNATHHANENVTIHLKVKDYAIWRTGYDGREKNRLSAGITNGRVFRDAQDPNDVGAQRTVLMASASIIEMRYPR